MVTGMGSTAARTLVMMGTVWCGVTASAQQGSGACPWRMTGANGNWSSYTFDNPNLSLWFRAKYNHTASRVIVFFDDDDDREHSNTLKYNIPNSKANYQGIITKRQGEYRRRFTIQSSLDSPTIELGPQHREVTRIKVFSERPVCWVNCDSPSTPAPQSCFKQLGSDHGSEVKGRDDKDHDSKEEGDDKDHGSEVKGSHDPSKKGWSTPVVVVVVVVIVVVLAASIIYVAFLKKRRTGGTSSTGDGEEPSLREAQHPPCRPSSYNSVNSLYEEFKNLRQ